MSLLYIIDGYNITHHPTFTKDTFKKNKDSRVALIELIKAKRLCGSSNNKVAVVFDGYPESGWQNADTGNIHVVFSRRQSADERIKKIAELSANPKTVVVISDDKEIKFFVKAAGCRHMGVEEFISSKERSLSKKESVSEVKVTYAQMSRINEELRKIWLK